MKTKHKKPATKLTTAAKRAPRTPTKPEPTEVQASPSPESSEMEGGHKGSTDGRFEANHRPSR